MPGLRTRQVAIFQIDILFFRTVKTLFAIAFKWYLFELLYELC